MNPAPTTKADLLKQEYLAFGTENPTRSQERQEELDEEIKELCAKGDSGNVINLVTQYNYEDGFYNNYPLILEQLINSGKIVQA